MRHQYDRHFLQHFVKKNCSETERSEFLKWLEGHPELIDQPFFHRVWEESDKETKKVLGAESKIFSDILKQISQKKEPQKQERFSESDKHFNFLQVWQLYPLFRYASIIFVVLIPILMISLFTPAEVPELAVNYIEKSTHRGQQLAFRLEDGTRISLNSGSRLRYPETFDDSSRVVYLEGVAFFNVARDYRRPFSVITGDIRTTALGTSFNVDFDSLEAKMEVSLITGSVELSKISQDGSDKKILLSPGEQMSCNLHTHEFIRTVFDPLEVSGWKDGIIYFNQANLSHIIETLENWYDVSISVQAKNKRVLDDLVYSGKFKNQTLENVLRGMSYVENFEFEIKDKNVKIMFN